MFTILCLQTLKMIIVSLEITRPIVNHAPSSVIVVVVHTFQTSSQNRLANQSQTSCGAPLGRGDESLYKCPGHMTKMAAMAINSFSRTSRSMILKLGMKHQSMELCKVCINHDPQISTYFTAKSTEVAHAFEWGNC